MVGRERNWDYRYSWVSDAGRDKAGTKAPGRPDVALRSFELMPNTAAGARLEPPLRTMFGIRGEHDLNERACR